MHNVTDGVSVADPGSRISDLESWIPDPTTAKKEEGEDICCPTFFVARNITKLKIILFFNWERKSLSQFTKKLSIIWVWDPWVKKTPDPSSAALDGR